MKLKTKLLLASLVSTISLAALMLIVSAYQISRLTAFTQRQLLLSAKVDLDHVASAAYRNVASFDESMRIDSASPKTINKLSASPELREAIMKAGIGKTGYIWVLGTKGSKRGCYVISLGGKRDGENIFNAKDANGGKPVQFMIENGEKLLPGEVLHHEYWWKNKGETVARKKLASICYYEPWGWLIGASAYEDDFLAPVKEASALGLKMKVSLVIVSILAMGAVALFFSAFSGKISKQITRLTKVAQAAAEGDIETASRLLGTTDKAA